MSDPGGPEGPRRPPRPPRPAGSPTDPEPRPAAARPAAAKPPKSAKPPKPPRPPKSAKPAEGAAEPGTPPSARPPAARRHKPPIPDAPGPRPEPVARPPRRRPPTTAPSGVTFRPPVPPPPSETVLNDLPAVDERGTAPAPRPSRRQRHDARADGETHTGRLRRIYASRPDPATLLPAQESSLSPFRRRFGVPYDTQGPKVRMGVLWAIAVVAVLAPQALRPWGLAVLYGICAGWAAAQVIEAHRGARTSADWAVAAFGGSALSVAATLGTQALGVGYLALVVVALAVAVFTPERGRLPIPRAGLVVAAAGICGGAAASLVLLAEYEIGALIILLVFVMVYDASDFIVGSGASNGIEGPLAGMLFIAAASGLFAVVEAPPFRGVDIWSFAVLAMIACPAGQILASALLPQANSHAPALRRLDSMLVVAPAWAGLVGLYLARV